MITFLRPQIGSRSLVRWDDPAVTAWLATPTGHGDTVLDNQYIISGETDQPNGSLVKVEIRTDRLYPQLAGFTRDGTWSARIYLRSGSTVRLELNISIGDETRKVTVLP